MMQTSGPFCLPTDAALRERIRAYFWDSYATLKKAGWFLIATGVLAGLCCGGPFLGSSAVEGSAVPLVVFGVVPAAAGIGLLAHVGRRLRQRALVEPEIDRLLVAARAALVARGLEKLGLHFATDSATADDRAVLRDPLLIHSDIGPERDRNGNVIPGQAVQVLRGSDERPRSNSHEVNVFYLSRHHLARYRCVFILEHESVRREETGDYHYKDVVGVETRTEATVSSGLTLLQHQFELQMTSGSCVCVPWHLSDSTRQGSGDVPDATVATIDTLRSALREKRAQYVRIANQD